MDHPGGTERDTRRQSRRRARALLVAALGGSLFGICSDGAFASDPAKGKTIYRTHCAKCHGSNGNALVPGAPSFSRGERLEKSDRSLIETLRRGKNLMPSWYGVLSERDMRDALAYIRNMARS